MFMGQDEFVWWIGVVEDNVDPELLCRVRVRIFGYHPKYVKNQDYSDSRNNSLLISDLPYATVLMSPNTENLYSRISVGEWVIGFFLDGKDAQEPVVFGIIPYNISPGALSGSYFGSVESKDRSFPQVTTTKTSHDFSNKENQIKLSSKSFKSETGHTINFFDHADKSLVQINHREGTQVELANNYIKLINKENTQVELTNNYIKLINKTTSIQLTSSDIVVSNASGSYNLIDQLNWISLQQHSVNSGGYDPHSHTFTIGRRPPPPPPSPPGRRRICFTEDTLVTMSDGSKKKISDIKVGESVLSSNKLDVNVVRFIEINEPNEEVELYSPNTEMEVFATVDHPIFIDDKLHSANAELSMLMYPWLGKIIQSDDFIVKRVSAKKLYNLWLSGDSSYIVNDFATTTIIYDGGMLSDFLELNLLDEVEIRNLYQEYTTKNIFLFHGAFTLNYILGKIKSKFIYRIVAYAGKHKFNSLQRNLIANIPMYIIGTLMRATSKLHKWRFAK